jgi:hypothetical protein
VRGLAMHNVRFEVRQPDVRPAVVFDHVADATVNGLSAQGNAQAESLLRFIDTREVLLSACRVLTPTPVFLRAEGADCAGIVVDGGDLAKAGAPSHFERGASPASVKLRT